MTGIHWADEYSLAQARLAQLRQDADWERRYAAWERHRHGMRNGPASSRRGARLRRIAAAVCTAIAAVQLGLAGSP